MLPPGEWVSLSVRRVVKYVLPADRSLPVYAFYRRIAYSWSLCHDVIQKPEIHVHNVSQRRQGSTKTRT